MATSEARLEQLKRSLQQARSAQQAAKYRIASLESAAVATTPIATTSSASMVDMRVLGKPSNFAGEEASWKSWSFVMLSFSSAVSPELRALVEKASTTADDMRNVDREAQRRLQNVPEGEGAQAWKAFSEHYEPKTATRCVGMLRQILLHDFGELSLETSLKLV